MTDRATCCVIGCRRTFKRDADDDGSSVYMCGNHYRLADKSFRQLRTQLKRRARREGWSDRLLRIDHWLWAKVEKQVTERAMGI